MSDEGEQAELVSKSEGKLDERLDSAVGSAESLMRVIEVIAAFVLVGLFGIGVFDLGLQIAEQSLAGRIFEPAVVVGFIDTVLLLFIIVEVFHTVVAYTRAKATRRIVRLVIYTGIIALVRKVIIFRTDTFADKSQALLNAGAYTALLIALSLLLFVERTYSTD